MTLVRKCLGKIAKKYRNSKALIYFLMESARHNKVVPLKTNSIHKLCVGTSSKILFLDTELCAPKSQKF